MKQSLTQSVTSRVLLTLTLVLASFVGFTGIAEAATCTSCHATPGQTTDIRPVDAAYRNITTGGFRGSHAMHIPAATLDANACSSCHGPGAATYDTKHRNGFINVTSATGVGYSKGTSFAQSGSKTLTLGSCSAASCHANPYGAGTITTPAWGTAAADCTACHTTPIGATGPATGSHTTTTAHAVACTTCHAAGTSATSMPTANHNNGTIDIENVGYPLAKAKGSAAATCSTASCHVNVYGAGSVTTPVWGTSASCNACHTVAIDSYGPNTGSHAKHNDSTCTDCHAAGTTQITKPTTGHADGNVTVTNGYPVTPKHAAGSYSGTCSTATCHADPYGPGQVTTPVWGTAAGCAACHTGAGAFTGTGTAPATGSHNKHMALASVACNQCHDGAVAGSSGGSAHATGKVNVTQAYTASPVVKHAAGTYAGTCTTVCHSATTTPGVTPIWNVAANCASCHEATPTTGKHTKHLLVSGVSCASCHTGATTTSYNSANHYDGKISVSNGYPETVKHAANVFSGTATCTTSCHSATATAGTTPAWNASTTCASCHDATPTTGTHTAHITAGASCGQCHSGATGTSGGSSHFNGLIDVSGYTASPVAKHAAGSYTGTCSTSCHSTNTSPVWGAAASPNDTCTKCHGTGTVGVTAANEYVVAPSDASGVGTGKVSSNAKIGAHQTHLQLFNGLSQQGADAKARCEVCHTLPTVGNHANGSSVPVFTGIAAGGTFNAVDGTCSVSCHNPAGSVLASGNAGTGTTPSWTNANYIADGTLKTDTNCNTCHKSPGTAGFTAAVDHGVIAMPLGIGTDCAGCHGHNGGIGGNAGQQHMDGIKFGNGSCDACHGYPPLTSAQLAARTGGAYANAKVEDYAGGAGHHSTHLLATVKASEGFTPCLPCHPSAFHNGGNGTVSKLFVNVNDAADTTFRFDSDRSKRYTVATQSCSNVSCHYQPTPAWTFGL